MGIVWEAYHKGVPLLGVPENPTEVGGGFKKTTGPIFWMRRCFFLEGRSEKTIFLGWLLSNPL